MRHTTLFAALALFAVTALADDTALIVKRSKPRKHETTLTGDISKEPPFVLDKDIVLPQTAVDALMAEHDWLHGENEPMRGADGRVVYVYGKGLPVIVTAPKEVTEIDLEPGEQLLKDGVDIGDPRFEVATHQIANPPQTYLVIKPTQSGLETTGVIGTDRRSYYVRLVSKPMDYLARVSFNYPEDEQRKKLAEMQAQRDAEAKKKADSEALKKADTTGPIKSTDYGVKVGRHAEYLRPVSVWDDGARTYIQLSEGARHRDLPILQLTGPTGPDTPNWRFDNKALTFTVDAIFERCELISGTGRHRLTVTIANHHELMAKN